MRKLLLLIVVLACSLQGYSQLVFNNTVTGQDLVNNLLGPGVIASNVTYTGAAGAKATFTCSGSCTLGFSNGIFLTTGLASGPTAPASYFASTDNGAGGDAQLSGVVGGTTTRNATILEFDFQVPSDSIKFEYIFGSEEYNDFVNTPYNDVFAFFISGPGITGSQNIALLPGTSTPVSINNVNNGGPYGGVASGPCTNCAYYTDNVGGASFFLDGYTHVLTAKARVYPCELYHMKIAIADVSDGIYDSGVLLKQNSFTAIGPVTVFANSTPIPNFGVYYACTGTNVNLCCTPAGSYNWNTGQTTQCITVNEANLAPNGIYEAIYPGPNGCFGYSQVQIVFVTPTATITPSGSLSLCPGGNVTLTANPGNSYTWSNGATTPSINVSTPGTYTVTVSNGPGCFATSTPVTVTVGSASASISGVLSLCNGANTTLTANVGQSYVWNTGATTQSINVTTAGNYTVTVTQSGGCTAAATVNVQVNPTPTPVITGTLSICQGNNTTLDAGIGYNSYSWNTGATTQTLNVTTSGTYTVTVTSPSGCTGTTSATVTVNNIPAPVITGNTTFCTGSNSNIDAGTGYSNYAWNTGASTQIINVTTSGTYTVTVTDANNCTSSSSVNITVNPLPTPVITGTFDFCQGSNTTISAGAGYSGYTWSTGASTSSITVTTGNTYTVTVTDANGCSNTTSQAITVNPNPVPSISGILTVCQGTSTTLSASPGFTAYQWSTGGSASTVNVNASGTYTVTVTDANGCSGSVSANVVVNPLPTPVITGTMAFCAGSNSNLNAGAGYSTYTWSTGASTQIINVTTSGTYTVTVTNSSGCSESTSATVTVNALPVPAITGTLSFCQGSNTSLNATPGYSTYQWNTGASTPSITVSTSGTYTVTVTDVNGCSGSTSQSTTVNANPVPVITGTNAICQGDNTIFDAGSGYASYSWSTGATSSTVNLAVAGTYTVTVTDMNGCTGTTSASLTVNPLPTPAITGNTAFCQGLNSNLNAGNGYSSYTWSTGATTSVINVTTSGTYTVTVTNSFGCSASTSILVTVNPLPTPAITGPSAICTGNSATLDAGNGYSGYLWSNGSTSQTINTGTAGNYTVTVTSAAGCSASASATLSVNPLPTPAITGITAICQGTTTTFDAGSGYTGYLWSNGATTQIISPAVAGVYSVTVTDANTCSASTSINLTVNSLPVPAISGTNEFCDGDNSNLNAGAGYANYEWNTGASTQVINVSASGTYAVTVTDNNGCSATTDLLVTVHTNPTPVILGGTGICQGTSTILSVPGSYATYIWNTGETTSTISVSTAGNYTVTVTSSFGCVGNTSTAMVVNPLPAPVITGLNVICQNETTTFDAGSGYNAYLWSDGSTTQTISPGVAGNYTVTVTDINGCQNNTSAALTVNPLPTPSITGNFTFCQNDNSDINAGPGYVSYIWNTGANSQVINVTTSGVYEVTVTDNNGCIAATSTIITVNQLPVPVITGATDICDGTTTIFNAGNYVSFEWNDGTVGQTLTTGVAGTYAVTVTDINGCTGSTSQSLTVYDLPTATISGTTAICYGQSTPLTVTFNGTAPFNYTWSDGSVTSPVLIAGSGTDVITVSPGTSTSYTVITISDAHCQGSATGIASITVNRLPQPVITGDLSICDGEITSLNATPGFVSYTWSNGSASPAISTGIGGIYTVLVTDLNGCEGTSPGVDLVVNSVPVVAFTNDTSLSCKDPRVNFTNQSVYDPGSVFSWDFGDGSTSHASNPVHSYSDPGTYPVQLVITTPAGCTSSVIDNVEILFYPLPVADFVTSPPVTNVFSGKIGFVDRSLYAVTWLWEFGDGDKSIEQNPSHYYNEVGDYKVRLTVTNVSGCEDVHQEIVNINPFYIPNAFSPNGDGVNDVFYNSGYNLDVASYHMKIFNRWGQVVFTGSGENDNWNGETQDGTPAPIGTYVYKIIIKTKGGKEHVFDGQVNLVR